MIRPPNHEWITTADAAAIRHTKAHAFSQWATRWNKRTDTINKVLRQRGLVERNSLMAAMAEAGKLHDAPNQAMGTAYQDLHNSHRTGKRRRRNAVAESLQKGAKH